MNGTVTYLGGDPIGVARVSGRISLIERDGKVVEVVVEGDGSATFIPANRVVAYEENPE